jgi:hypothetical protein
MGPRIWWAVFSVGSQGVGSNRRGKLVFGKLVKVGKRWRIGQKREPRERGRGRRGGAGAARQGGRGGGSQNPYGNRREKKNMG